MLIPKNPYIITTYMALHDTKSLYTAKLHFICNYTLFTDIVSRQDHQDT